MRRSPHVARYFTFATLFVATACSGGGGATPATGNDLQPKASQAAHRVNPNAAPVSAFYVDPNNSRLIDVQLKKKVSPLFIKGFDYGPTQIGDYPDPNPLDNANSEIWTQDLDAMRAAGANALKVYNVTLTDFVLEKPKAGQTGKINKFLNAAWNGGDRPIFVVLSIFFGGADVLDKVKLAALKAEYAELSKDYSGFPAVMGMSIGSEINSEAFINNPTWWKNLNQIGDEISAGFEHNGVQRILTTTMVDDGLNTVVAGEKYGFKIDAWGLDAYRGKTFTTIWTEGRADTTKPLIMAEYGAPAAYHTTSTAKYDANSGVCHSYPGTAPPPEDAKDLPDSGNPQMQFLTDYVTGNATELGANWAENGGIGDGGFYFEWNDEWWKSGYPKAHLGGAPGDGKIIVNRNANFPGCYQDEAWFGLNAQKEGSPNRPAPRPPMKAIKKVWASQG